MEKHRSSPSRSIDNPTVDPLGTKRKLHRPFAFTKVTPRYNQVEGYIVAAEPFDTLPRVLIASRRLAYKPPVMRYAWLAPRDLILEYARTHKLTRQYGRALSEFETMNRAVAAINKKCGALIPDTLLKLRSTLLGGMEHTTLVISLYTNFDLKRRDLPSGDAIELIRQALDLKEPPKWFLDGLDWR